MKIKLIYRQNSDHAREVTNFAEMIQRRYPDKTIVHLDVDTREGAEEASLYDVTQYPAVLVTSSQDGRLMGLWQGLPLPLIDEVIGYALEQESYTV